MPEAGALAPRSETRAGLLATGVFVLAFVAGMICHRIYFAGGMSFEFCHYGEIARNVVEGRGFSTATWYPSYQALLESAGHQVGSSAPVLDRFPLQVAWVALFEAVFGANDLAVALAQAAAHALWCAAIFLLGRRLFGDWIAAIAAALWAIDPMLPAGFVLHGYADVLSGLVFLALNVTFVSTIERDDASATPRARLARWGGVGALAAVCYLSRYTFVVFIPVYALVLLRSRGLKRGLEACAAAGAGLVAIVAPWAAYSFFRSGILFPPSFTVNLAHGVLLDGLPWMDYRVYAASDVLTGPAIVALGAKWLTLFFRLLEDLPSYWYLTPAWLLAAAWWLGRGDSPARRFAHLGLLLLAWQIVVFSFLRYEILGYMNGRYYLWFGPFVLLGAASCVDDLRARAGARWARWVGGVAVAILLADFAFRYGHIVRGSGHPSGRDVGDWPEIRWIAEHTGPNDLIVTNIPAQIAWYAKRPSVALMNEPAGLRAYLAKHAPAFLFLSATRVGELDNFPAWRALLKGDSRGIEAFCAEYGFEVAETFQGGILLRPVR